MADLKTKIENIIIYQNTILRQIDYIISRFPELRDSFQILSSKISEIDDFALSEKADVVISEISTYNDLLKRLNSILDKNLILFNTFTADQNAIIDNDKVKISVKDSAFRDVGAEFFLDSNKNMFSINTDNLVSDLYYIFISQNYDSTNLFPNLIFSFYSVEKINNNASKLILSINDQSQIANIINNNLLSDTKILINGKSVYHIARFGSSIINNSKKIALYIYPTITETNIESITFHENLFDDQILELNMINYDINDISSFYFNDAERDLTDNTMVIFDKNKFPKYTFNYKLDGNKERRNFNG